MITVIIALYAATFAFGYIAVSYDTYADYQGWVAGALFRRDVSVLKILGIMGMLVPTIAALILLPWWTVFPVVLIGYGAAFILRCCQQ